MTEINPHALLDEIDALRAQHDEFSRARRVALQKRFWQWQWEQAFRAMCEPRPSAPLIEDSDKPENG